MRDIYLKDEGIMDPLLHFCFLICIIWHSVYLTPVSSYQLVDWDAADASLEVDRSVPEVDWAIPGTTGGLRQLESFIKERLRFFGANRNNPNKDALSNMSPWYHFGENHAKYILKYFYSSRCEIQV